MSSMENWSPGEKSLQYVIGLEGDLPTVTVQSRMQAEHYPEQRHTFEIDQVRVITRWPVNEDALPVKQHVALRTTGGGTLYPNQLDEIPSWLVDIVTRASPRDVDWPDMEPRKPYPKRFRGRL